MDRTQFSKRFKDAIAQLYSHTHVLCFNELSPHYKFILTTNTRISKVILDDIEIAYRKDLNELKQTPISMNEAIDMLCRGDRVPLWINMSVYEAREDVTLIKLICARHLKREEELTYKVDKYPPFHISVPIPSQKNKKETDSKFDVNWRFTADKQKEKHLISRIKNYFSKV